MGYCSICAEETEDGLHVLDCGHCFHSACIIQWFRMGNNACPNCRSEHAQRQLYIQTASQRIANMRRRKHLPPELKRSIEKLSKMREEHFTSRSELATFVKEHKTIITVYNKQVRKNASLRWKYQRMLRLVSNMAMPGVPFAV